LIGLIKWEFEYTLFAFQDELVYRLLLIKDNLPGQLAMGITIFEWSLEASYRVNGFFKPCPLHNIYFDNLNVFSMFYKKLN
jgi:hypothetical protein